MTSKTIATLFVLAALSASARAPQAQELRRARPVREISTPVLHAWDDGPGGDDGPSATPAAVRRIGSDTSGAGKDATMPCPACGGSGHKAAADCMFCRGTGKCSACGGTGARPSGMKGSLATRCVNCRGTGRCSACRDLETGEPPPCPRCRGTGRAPSPPARGATAGGGASSGTRPAPPAIVEDPAVIERRNEELDKALADYTNTIAKLDHLLTLKQAEPVPFLEPDERGTNNIGRLFISRAYLLQAHVKGVRVAGYPQDIDAGGELMLPRTLDVAEKAERVLRSVAPGGQVLIIYGLVNTNNVTLFDLAAE